MNRVLLVMLAATLGLGIASGAAAAPITGPITPWTNGHYYQMIDLGNPQDTGSVILTWEQARDAAAAASYSGLQGHLVTITSQTENDFVWGLVQSTADPWNKYAGDWFQWGASGGQWPGWHSYWLGASQDTSATAAGEGWKWVTGEDFAPYNKWNPGEPNDSGGSENYLIFWCNNIGTATGCGTWNDTVKPTASTYDRSKGWVSDARGYIIEYEAAPVPEPGTLILLGTGLLGALGLRRKLIH